VARVKDLKAQALVEIAKSDQQLVDKMLKTKT